MIGSVFYALNNLLNLIYTIKRKTKFQFIIYTISTNEWSDSITYINSCLSKATSLIFDYYDISNEFTTAIYTSFKANDITSSDIESLIYSLVLNVITILELHHVSV